MLTLSGSNFGPTGTSPTTSIGATQCTTSIWISTTSIECMLPAGMGAQATVVASISSSASLIGTLRSWLTYDGALLTLLCSGEHRMRTDQRRSERSRRGRCDCSACAYDGLGCGECACQLWQWHKFDFERHELRDLGPEPDRVARSCVLIHRMDIVDDDHVRFTARRVDNHQRDHQPGGGDEGWILPP